jgi:AraC-like DNA-binding protein
VTVEQYFPSDRLSPFIKSYLFIESDRERGNTVLPDTSMVMALRYKGRIDTADGGTLPSAVLSGIRDSSRLIHYEDDTANLIVNFKPGAAAAFFHEPLHELFGQWLPAHWLKNGAGLSLLSEQLAETPGKKAQLALVEKVLLRKLLQPTPDLLVNAAIQSIGSAHGNLRIAALAKELYISRDALEKRFRGSVGTSPKHFSSILRLRNAISNHASGKSLTDVALTAGYYDQAHFIRDFRAFTGQSPKRFFNERNFW